MKQTKYFLSILLVILLTLTPNAIAEELPDLGERSKTILSPKKEKLLGKEFMKAVKLRVSILDDPIINQYIKNIGNTLVAHSSIKNKSFHFFVVNDPAINAFAGPDAHVGVNSGTIIATNSDSELAAIIAHEIAHVTQHHIARLIETARNTQMVAVAGMMASMILGSVSKNNSASNIANGSMMASIGGATQHMINFTRTHEAEADNIAIKILERSGFDPKVMPKIFMRVKKLNFSYDNEIPSFLRTHPYSSHRIAEAKNRINPNQAINTNQSQHDFNLIKVRTKALTANDQLKAIRFFESQLKPIKHKNNMYLQYGYALALYKNLQYSKATKIVGNLLEKFPNEKLFQMLGAELTTSNKEYEKAIGLLKKSLAANPNYEPLTIQYAKTLITAKEYRSAELFIRKAIRKNTDCVELYQLLARAYAGNKKIADAYQARAKAYEINGYDRQAAILLQQALKTPKLNSTDKMIINAKIDLLKQSGARVYSGTRQSHQN